MSRAIKCDRCGKYILVYNIMEITDSMRLLTVRSKGRESGWFQDLDLCPDCYKELEKFMTYEKVTEYVESIPTADDIETQPTFQDLNTYSDYWPVEGEKTNEENTNSV